AANERERERLDTRIEELDLELSIDDRSWLPDQLVQALFDDRAVAALVRIDPVSWPRRVAVDRHTEAQRDSLTRRPHHEVKVARVKAIHHAPVKRAKNGGLTVDRPLADQRPLIEGQSRGGRIDATAIASDTARRCEVLRSLVSDVILR